MNGATMNRQRIRYTDTEVRQFAERLREWRGHMGVSQKDAADQIGVSFRTYQQWEAGKTQPSAEGLAKLLDAGAPTVRDNERDRVQEFQERVLAELAELRHYLRDEYRR